MVTSSRAVAICSEVSRCAYSNLRAWLMVVYARSGILSISAVELSERRPSAHMYLDSYSEEEVVRILAHRESSAASTVERIA